MFTRVRSPLLLLAAAVYCSCFVPCRAAAFGTGGVAPFTIAPSADTLSFNALTGAVSPGGSMRQTGAWTIQRSGNPSQNIPFTFDDTVTLNGMTRVLTFSAALDRTPGQDTLSVFALAPVTFGNLSVAFGSFTASDANLETLPVELNASVSAVTAEPSTLLLLGTGIIGSGFLMILRARTSQSQRPSS